MSESTSTSPASPRKVQAPAPAPRRWRVRVEGVKVRVADAEGRPSYQDHLDVEALSPGDAVERFKAYNGIIATSARADVQPLE